MCNREPRSHHVYRNYDDTVDDLLQLMLSLNTSKTVYKQYGNESRSGNFRSRELSFQGANWPGSEKAATLLIERDNHPSCLCH